MWRFSYAENTARACTMFSPSSIKFFNRTWSKGRSVAAKIVALFEMRPRVSSDGLVYVISFKDNNLFLDSKESRYRCVFNKFLHVTTLATIES